MRENFWPMAFEIIDHVADVRIRVTGALLEEVFSSAAESLVAVLRPEGRGETRQHTIELEGDDPTLLLVDFLNELLWRMLSYRETYDRIVFDAISETHVDAIVEGHAVDAFGDDVKAVTYHEADLKRNENGTWETLLVFDI